MTTGLTSDTATDLAEALRAHVKRVHPAGPRRSGFWLDRRTEGIAWLDEHWLRLSVFVRSARLADGADAAGMEDLLRRNALLPGTAKIALGTHAHTISVLVDLPFESEAVGPLLEQQIATAVAHLHEVVRRLRTAAPRNTDELPAAIPSATAKALGPLAEVCREASWPAAQRAEWLVVDLEVPGGLCQARLTRRASGAVRASVEFVAPGGLPICRHASAALLLAAGDVVRLARPVLGDAYGWEVNLGNEPGPGDLDRALASLAVACGATAEELEALQEEQIARAFLATRHAAG